jgi:hypothetical protein
MPGACGAPARDFTIQVELNSLPGLFLVPLQVRCKAVQNTARNKQME